MFQTSVLASGSKGNAILVRTESTSILIDAGLSGKKILSLFEKIKLEASCLKAIVVSHEHRDHISGAGILSRKLGIPIYISQKTYHMGQFQLGKLTVPPTFFCNGELFRIGNIIVDTFMSSHDVVDGSNFIVTKANDSERKLGIATDLGFSSRLLIQKMKQASCVILESNHDEELLYNGPYPWNLKQRVKSRQGHLSNEQAVGIISQILHPGLKNIILAHLSEQNNKPEIAFQCMSNYLKMVNHNSKLLVSAQHVPTPLIDI
jgi:phosphoribosyl 1,2-cyclic phosphodiesterase